jgi:small conductance mechanosensitive channel
MELPVPSSITQPLVALLPNIAVAAATLAVSYLVARLAKRIAQRAMTRAHAASNVIALVGNLSYLAILVVGFALALSSLGFYWSNLLAIIGVLGLAISLAIQDVLRNFVAGAYMLIERPFKIGDVIAFRDVRGVVEAIEIRTTYIRREDGQLLFVPNYLLFTEVLGNISASGPLRYKVSVSAPGSLEPHGLQRAYEVLVATMNLGQFGTTPRLTFTRLGPAGLGAEIEFWAPRESTLASEVVLELGRLLPGCEITLER